MNLKFFAQWLAKTNRKKGGGSFTWGNRLANVRNADQTLVLKWGGPSSGERIRDL